MRKFTNVEELGDLLELPKVATLATYRKDGTVLLSPVWHEWRDGGFNVTIERLDAKHRNVKRDPRASIAVYDDDPPYRGIEVRGIPRIVEEDAAETQRRIAIRYLGPEAGEAYASTPSGTEVTLRLEPGDFRAWDFAEDF